MGSKMDLFKFKDKYGKELRCQDIYKLNLRDSFIISTSTH